MAEKIKKKGLFLSTEALGQNMKKQSERWNNSNLLNNQLAPELATVYAVNLEKTTVYEGTEDIRSLIGPDSPLRFDKVYDYRILVDSEVFGPDTKESYGFQIDSSLNVNLLPGSVNLEDLSIICLKGMPGIYFKITNSNLSRVMPTTYSQSMISVAFTNQDLEKVSWLEKQVVNEWTMVKYSQGSYVLNNKVLEKRDSLFDIDEDILENFLAMYYNKDIGSVTVKTNDSNSSKPIITYDPYLVHFLTRNGVLSARDNKIFKLCNSSEVHPDEDFELKYRNTIFYKIEKKKKIKESNLKYFMYSYSVYADSMKWSRFFELKIENKINIVTMDERPQSGIISYNPSKINDPNESSLDNIIATYLSVDIDDIKTDMFSVLEDYYEPRSYDNMVKLSLCMYILHLKISNIHGKNMDSNIIEEVV